MTVTREPAQHTLRGRSSAETRSAVLDLIRVSGEISRVDLARRSALTEATISKIVKELLSSGLVVQAGFAESTGGKRPALLKLNGGGLYALGLTMDFHRCTIVLCGPDGSVLARDEVAGTGRDEPAVALDRLAAAIGALLNARAVDRSRIIGLGVASAGRRGAPPIGSEESSVFDVWEPFPLEEQLEARTGLPVVRENDANCAALGEFWTSQEPSRDFACVYMSNGVGVGIVINGAIYRGASGNAGEIGHTVVDPAGLACWCGSRGCLETVASPRALVRDVLADAALADALGVDDATEAPEVYRRFADRVAAGDAAANRLLAPAAEHFSAAVGSLVNTLDLDLVVLAGSGFAGVGETLLAAVRDRLRDAAFMRDVHPITVRLAATGSESAALGAASVVLHRHLTPHRAAASR